MTSAPTMPAAFSKVFAWIKERHELALTLSSIVALLISGIFRQENTTLFVVFLSLVAGSLLWLAWQSRRVRSPFPLVRRVVAPLILALVLVSIAGWSVRNAAAGTPKMGGDVNVLVTSLRDTGESGGGLLVSSWFEGFLLDEFSAPVGGKSVETKRVEDQVLNEDQALALGYQHGAHVVVYGDVRMDGEQLSVNPKYAFTGRGGGSALTPQDMTGLAGASALGESFETKISELEESNAQSAKAILLFLVGVVTLLSGEYDVAADVFRDTLTLAPENAVVHFFLGKATARRGAAEAMSHYDAAIEHDPEYARAYVGRANLRYLDSRNTNPDTLLLVAEEYEDALTKDHRPKGKHAAALFRASVHYGQGNVYYALTLMVGPQYEGQARQAYQEVLREDSSCELAWWDLRVWGPWDTFLDPRPPFCEVLSDLAESASGLMDTLAILVQTPSAPWVTATPVPTSDQQSETLVVTIHAADSNLSGEDSFEIQVLKLAEPGLGAWTIDVEYDPEIVSLLACVSDFASVCETLPDAKGIVRASGAEPSGITGDASIATIVFACKRPGTSLLTPVVAVLADATQPQPQPLEADVVPGEIACIP